MRGGLRDKYVAFLVYLDVSVLFLLIQCLKNTLHLTCRRIGHKEPPTDLLPHKQLPKVLHTHLGPILIYNLHLILQHQSFDNTSVHVGKSYLHLELTLGRRLDENL